MLAFQSMTLNVILIYVLVGLAFLVATVYLQTKGLLAIKNAGNTAQALSVEFAKFKVQTFAPVVALSIIAFAATIVMPIYYMRVISQQDDDDPVIVSVPLGDAAKVSAQVQLNQPNDGSLYVFRSGFDMEYILKRETSYEPVTMFLRFQREPDPRIQWRLAGGDWQDTSVKGSDASIDHPIPWKKLAPGQKGSYTL